ncbi:basic membrane protein A [Alkalithermobacter thermoalcaliphilus JW-YL-7 = DSM 7308]|uniref:Basic membrane lipoprotein n=1 Tax=Alkalithermobacter thermoalcaliphilus JW-YL-7 = DSM 7308 TaxID=1121328 RepID=A0A150FNW1_CLOPD|nr:basic membrane lipoprotein [[Clostridium] paradoxum JW-YL-7 = DSM 7308]SHK83704.1 basic membrane protein A [[Clostridium] paradoxum JW-YL-7 = DSM 7308]
MKRKLLSMFVASTLLLGSLTACAPKQAPTGGDKSGLKVSMVTDVGGVNDQSFNQSAWEGLQRAEKDFGIKVSYQESHQEADYAPNIEILVDQNADLIWGVGFKMGDAIQEAAGHYPDNKFAIIDYAYENTPENVIGVIFKEEEASYLVGLIAGKMTQTNKIGFIGGMDVPVINRFQYGFIAGVKQANPDATVEVQFANAFDDPAKGKAIAKQMYQRGVDIIFHAAGDTGTGMIEAAKEEGKFAIGVDRDQNDLAPDNVITSAMKRVDNAIYEVSKELSQGKFEGGRTIVYGLKEGGVDIAPTTSKNVPKEILDFVEQEKQRIINGEFKVPSSQEELDKM